MRYVKVNTLSSTWSSVGFLGHIVAFDTWMLYLLKTHSVVCEVNRPKFYTCYLFIIRNVCQYLIILIQQVVSLVVRVLIYPVA